MCIVTMIVKLVILFNTLEPSVDNITNTISYTSYFIDNIKNKYVLIKHDIFSPENSVSAIYGNYPDSLKLILSQLGACKLEIYEKLVDIDVE